MKNYTAHIEPCHFCGCTLFNSRDKASEFVKVSPSSPDGCLHVGINGDGFYWVRCGNCYAQGPHYAGEGRKKLNRGPVYPDKDRDKTALAIIQAIDAWNLHEPPQQTIWECE